MISEQDIDSPIKVFVSYSHKDVGYKDELLIFLQPLVSKRLIVVWDDFEIPPGDDWRDTIQREIDEAGIFLPLVSADYIASTYCLEEELPRAMRRHASRQSIVIPIVVREALWEDTCLGTLQALPKRDDGEIRPVARWGHRPLALKNVANGLRHAINFFFCNCGKVRAS